MKIDEALGLLRDADPAAGVDSRWTAVVDSVDRSPQRAPRVWLAAAAAAVLVAGVATGVAVTRGDGSHTTRGKPPAGFIRPGAPDPHRLATISLVERMVRAVPDLPGASRSVLSDLTVAGNYVARERSFTAPGTVQRAAAFFTAHPPAGTVIGPPGPTSPTYWTVFYEAAHSAATSGVETQIAIAPTMQGVIVRIGTGGNWIPSRTTDSIVGVPDAIDATVVVDRVGANPVTTRKRLTGAIAARVGKAADRAAGVVPVGGSCPLKVLLVRVDVQIHTARGTYAITVPGGCRSQATITTPSGQRYLVEQSSIVGATYAALGLPKDYGFR